MDLRREVLGRPDEVWAALSLQRTWRRRSLALPAAWAHLVRDGAQLTVSLHVGTAGSESAGVALRSDAVRPFVDRVEPHLASVLGPYDELLRVNGARCRSKGHAARLLREASGAVEIAIRRPARLCAAVHRAQEAARNAIARRLGLVRRVVVKPSLEARLGITFDASWAAHSVIRRVREAGSAAGILRVDDRLVRVNGVSFEGRPPAATAQALKASLGRIDLLLQPAARFEPSLLAARERSARRARAERALDQSEECAICLSTLSEPVFWPHPVPHCVWPAPVPNCGCDHLFCRPCLREWARCAQRKQGRPLCPLCRAPASPSSFEEGELLVDEDVEALLLRAAGGRGSSARLSSGGEEGGGGSAGVQPPH